MKQKLLRANHAHYVTKTLRKAVMRRSNLQTKYFETRTPESLKKYKKQKNYCSRLYKKRTQNILQQPKSQALLTKNFWKNIQPIFTKNRKITNKITLVGIK